MHNQILCIYISCYGIEPGFAKPGSPDILQPRELWFMKPRYLDLKTSELLLYFCALSFTLPVHIFPPQYTHTARNATVCIATSYSLAVTTQPNLLTWTGPTTNYPLNKVKCSTNRYCCSIQRSYTIHTAFSVKLYAAAQLLFNNTSNIRRLHSIYTDGLYDIQSGPK